PSLPSPIRPLPPLSFPTRRSSDLRKASKLYDFIDTNDFYANPIAPRFRSWMNVPFTLADDALNGEFLKGADARGLLNLQGHRSRSEEHTSELQSRENLVCRLLREK